MTLLEPDPDRSPDGLRAPANSRVENSQSCPDVFDPFRFVAEQYLGSGRLDRTVELMFRLSNSPAAAEHFDNVLKASRKLMEQGPDHLRPLISGRGASAGVRGERQPRGIIVMASSR